MAEPVAAGKAVLHIAMFPWLAFGHLIPFMELAKLLAQKGHRVSFISTPRNIQRLPNKPPQNPTTHLITFVPLPLPRIPDLPAGAEATMDLPLHQVHLLKSAHDLLREPLARFLESSSPDWIIYDFAPHWLPQIAADLGISRVFFSIFSSWFAAFVGPVTSCLDGHPSRTKPEHFTVPPNWIPFPSNAAFRPYQAKQILQSTVGNASGVSDELRIASTVMGSDVFAIRSCTELEADWLKLLGDINGKAVIPVGLMPPSVPTDEEDAWLEIGDWLDEQVKGSVVYVALGSEAAPSQEQLTELALGLGSSGLPFFWVLRGQRAELPEGFEDRVRGRGIVWTRWAPQLRILSHDSVGGFLTHCGWSSIIEGLQLGLPLVMLPFLWDQGINARVLEEKKVGVEVPRGEEDGSLRSDSVAESLRLVMVEEEGRIYRERAMEWGKIFGDKDLHDRYIDEFVECLQNPRRVQEGSSSSSLS
ncbi:putative UDP-rhamnose:rhamnosyltransferase 1 [Malania oleifera]|uniref:putative UDP-rhamnose:rhamnosyltransferase 1 n=1 Tax=Malania oleifera TaxID=397392 RepID=UPI0025ADB22D|nr:putative UDP-rhamnose:rhamnosyltransferase 1 [Malania oleifera]